MGLTYTSTATPSIDIIEFSGTITIVSRRDGIDEVSISKEAPTMSVSDYGEGRILEYKHAWSESDNELHIAAPPEARFAFQDCSGIVRMEDATRVELDTKWQFSLIGNHVGLVEGSLGSKALLDLLRCDDVKVKVGRRMRMYDKAISEIDVAVKVGNRVAQLKSDKFDASSQGYDYDNWQRSLRMQAGKPLSSDRNEDWTETTRTPEEMQSERARSIEFTGVPRAEFTLAGPLGRSIAHDL